MSKLNLQWEWEGHEHRHAIRVGEQVTIGRRDDCNIVIGVSTVSRQHALIYAQQGVFMVRNLSQTNPIRLNNQHRLNHEQTSSLSTGDLLQIGPVTFQITVPPAGELHKLRCASCNRVLDYNPSGFCPWCGMALAAGQTLIDLE